MEESSSGEEMKTESKIMWQFSNQTHAKTPEKAKETKERPMCTR